MRHTRTRRIAQALAALACAGGVLIAAALATDAASARSLGMAGHGAAMRGGALSHRAFAGSRAPQASRFTGRGTKATGHRAGRHPAAAGRDRPPSRTTRRIVTDEPTRPRLPPRRGGAVIVDYGPRPVHDPARSMQVRRSVGDAQPGTASAQSPGQAYRAARNGGESGRPLLWTPARGETRFVPDEVLVAIAAGASAADLDAMARRLGLMRLEVHEFRLTGRRVFRWRIEGGRPVANVIRSLGKERRIRIAWAQPNYLYKMQDATERTEPPSAEASGADQAAPQYAAAKLRLTEAHKLARGDNVLVAVIDSGIDAGHPDLDGVVADRFDALGGEDKAHAHGTAMAGVIASHGRLTGVAPGVRILAVRAFGSGSMAAEGTTFQVLKGLDWAHAKGAQVVNMSFAGPFDPALGRALAAARQKGLTLIAAAGNAGPKSPPLYPAADPNVIAVTATDADDNVFAQANRGTHIAVAAPGVDIIVPAPDRTYGMATGTSVAAAQVSGVAALILQRKAGLGPDRVRRILTKTAHPKIAGARSSDIGAGLADAYAALLSATRDPAAQADAALPPR